jgi:hypothetical protein
VALTWEPDNGIRRGEAPESRGRRCGVVREVWEISDRGARRGRRCGCGAGDNGSGTCGGCCMRVHGACGVQRKGKKGKKWRDITVMVPLFLVHRQ